MRVKEVVSKIVSLKAGRRSMLLREAEAARHKGLFIRAAELYDEALKSGVPTKRILMQAGHMHKEARNFDKAELCYAGVVGLAPHDPEIYLQLGHFYKTIGRFEDALQNYRKAIALRPGWEQAVSELKNLMKSDELRREQQRKELRKDVAEAMRESGNMRGRYDNLLDHSLVPKTKDELYVAHQPAFIPTRNGTPQTTQWGTGLTVRGITALRGYIVSDVPYLYIDIFIDGKKIYHGELSSAPQDREKINPNMRKYCYNAWVDVSGFEPGFHEFFFRAVNINGDSREGIDWRREQIIIAPSFEERYYQGSDALIPPVDPDSPLSLTEQINARPSLAHKCSTRSLPFEPKTIAVLRPDQLGDMVASVPALLRLRESLPDARIVGLLSAANEGLASTLGVFDEIVLIDFPDCLLHRDRIMTLEEQEALARQLAPYKFDMVLDMPVSGNSSKLLPLIGAPVTIGFGGPRKSMDLNFSTYDPTTGCDFVKHSARTRILAEAVALSLDSGARVLRRDDISREVLEPYGVSVDRPYIVLHAGSRIKFTQWPHYAELAVKIVRELGVRVVFMSDTKDHESTLPDSLLRNGEIIFLSGKMPFDHFDAFLSFSTVFVGNDSGPKHLASLRGAQVVSLHSSRIGWQEWGQETTGVAISRQVPCAGCSLHHNYEECGQDVICIKGIKLEEVFREVKILFENSLEKA